MLNISQADSVRGSQSHGRKRLNEAEGEDDREEQRDVLSTITRFIWRLLKAFYHTSQPPNLLPVSGNRQAVQSFDCWFHDSDAQQEH